MRYFRTKVNFTDIAKGSIGESGKDGTKVWFPLKNEDGLTDTSIEYIDSNPDKFEEVFRYRKFLAKCDICDYYNIHNIIKKGSIGIFNPKVSTTLVYFSNENNNLLETRIKLSQVLTRINNMNDNSYEELFDDEKTHKINENYFSEADIIKLKISECEDKIWFQNENSFGINIDLLPGHSFCFQIVTEFCEPNIYLNKVDSQRMIDFLTKHIEKL